LPPLRGRWRGLKEVVKPEVVVVLMLRGLR
jgi:hypothetical protein